MGSICYIERNSKRWTVLDRGTRLKTTGEKLVTVRCGDFDDYPAGTVDIEIYMRKSILDKLLTGEYRVSPNSRFHGSPIVLRQDGSVVPPIEEGFCY